MRRIRQAELLVIEAIVKLDENVGGKENAIESKKLISMISDAKGMCFVILDDNRKIVVYITSIPISNLPDTYFKSDLLLAKEEGALYLEGLVIDPELQKNDRENGSYQAIVDNFLEEVKKEGYKKVGVHFPDGIMITLYEKLLGVKRARTITNWAGSGVTYHYIEVSLNDHDGGEPAIVPKTPENPADSAFAEVT